VIPERWTVEPFGKFIKSAQNGFGRRPNGNEVGPVVLRIADVAKGFVDLSDTRRITMSQDEFRSYQIHRNDLLFVRVNGSRDYVAQCIWVSQDYPDVAFNDHLIRVKLAPNVDSQFLQYVFRWDVMRARLLSFIPLAQGGQLTVNQTALSNVEIPIPPLEEQRKIADILSTWDEAIEKLEKLIAAKQKRKRALMQGLLTGKKRFKEFGLEWETVVLVDLVDFLDSQRIPMKQLDRANMQGQYPYCGASGIIDYVNDYIFDDDLILLAEDGANIIDRSSPIVYRMTGKFWVNNHAHVLKPKKNVAIGYLLNFLESLNYETYNTGTAQPKLNRQVSEQIPINIPSYAEQQKIASVLSAADAEIETLQKQLDLYKQQKRGLMQVLLTGKKRVKLDEVAA
jgi:type I restriction enzyme, S subunit